MQVGLGAGLVQIGLVSCLVQVGLGAGLVQIGLGAGLVHSGLGAGLVQIGAGLVQTGAVFGTQISTGGLTHFGAGGGQTTLQPPLRSARSSRDSRVIRREIESRAFISIPSFF